MHDVNIFKANAQHHLSRTAKSAAERAQNATDNGIGSEVHSNNWAILADKGYQGAASIACIISPHKAVHGILTLEQQQQNQRISHDRIIVEIFFGRMKTYGVPCRILINLEGRTMALMPLGLWH